MKAPVNPTVVPNEPVHDRYEIQFAPELVEFILKEGKIKTYRYGNKYDYLQVGDKVKLIEYGSRKLISSASIVSKDKMKFKEIPLDLNGHEVFESKEHQRKVFSSYYKYINREIVDEDEFLVISYSLIN